MSKTVDITDPRLNSNEFTYLQVDSSGKYLNTNPDSTLKNLQNYVSIIYNNIVLFNNENSNVNNLNRYAIIINTNITNIINIATPCIQDKTDVNIKCALEKCKYMNEIQNILLEFELILTNITIGNDIKNKYDFLPFFTQYNFVSVITANPSNKNISIDKYILCNTITYLPISDNPELQEKFQALLAEKTATQTEVIQANNTQFLIKILIYVFVCVVIYIIFIFVVKKYFSNKQDIKKISKLVGGVFHTDSKINYF